MDKRERIILAAKAELARREFWSYCRLMAPDMYKTDRKYLKRLCDTLQSFYSDPNAKRLIINLPPRHGKSRTAGLFVQWVLGNNPSEKIMTGSYNETLSTVFSKGVRNAIQTKKASPEVLVYSDVFPGVRIKQGDAAMQMWALEGQHVSYLATSPSGTATGFGASLMIIDDIIKSAEEAYNDMTKAAHWEWYANTMLSRLEEGGKVIIIMTRWATNDLAGRMMEEYNDVQVVTEKALQDDGTMLCPDLLSRESFDDKARAADAAIVAANYQQEPVDIKGRLYSELKTYDNIPAGADGRPLFDCIKNYTDTADTGADFLCSICYGVYGGEAYVLDLLYTQAPMEQTEPATAAMLHRNAVNVAEIESNNGGRGFARSVRDHLRNDHGSNMCTVRAFHQSKNKQARILSNATWVMEHIYFPKTWRDRWPQFYEAMTTYQRTGRNAHDDAPDAVTGVAEMMTQRAITPTPMRVNY